VKGERSLNGVATPSRVVAPQAEGTTHFRNFSLFTFHLSQISLPPRTDLDTVRPQICKDLRDWLLVGMSFIGC
jgi:hypothetical protein